MPQVAGLSYRIVGDCWICDDERVRSCKMGQNLRWRIKVLRPEYARYHIQRDKLNIITLSRYVYVALNGHTDYLIRHNCKHSNCINPDHLYESTPSTRQGGDHIATPCLNCFSLKYAKDTNGEKVFCATEAYKNGEDFPLEDAFKNMGLIRALCPCYDHEEGMYWTKRVYQRMRVTLLQSTLPRMA